jgi:hypothetical protein
VRPAARIDDAPSGARRILLVLDEDGDAYVPIATRGEAELAAELYGVDPASIDYSEVGRLLRPRRRPRANR